MGGGFQREARGSQLENYIAIGCTSGIYVSKRTERTEDYCESLRLTRLIHKFGCPQHSGRSWNSMSQNR